MNNKIQHNETLSGFIFNNRENLGYSARGLAKKANLDISVIEDIESGRELFLSTTVRQKLSSALKIPAAKIKSLEKTSEEREKTIERLEKIEELKIIINSLTSEENETALYCPDCGEKLVYRNEVMYDLEDNPIMHPKANCTKCPFQIK